MYVCESVYVLKTWSNYGAVLILTSFHLQPIYLDEAKVLGMFSKALSTAVKAILPYQPMSVATHTAGFGEKGE